MAQLHLYASLPHDVAGEPRAMKVNRLTPARADDWQQWTVAVDDEPSDRVVTISLASCDDSSR